MKSKVLKSIGIAILCLAIVLGNVLAFSLGTTDGVWGYIDRVPGDGYPDDASCDGWGRATNNPYTIWDVLGVIYNVNVGPGGEDERWVRNNTVCSGDVDGDITFAADANFVGWTYTSGTPSWAGFGSYTGCTNATGLFISEYAYDQINNNNDDKIAIEIYNGTTGIVNLGTYKLLLFTNDRDPIQVTLSGNLAIGGTYVVANDAADGNVNQQLLFANNDSIRTVVLIQNYDPQVINAIDTGNPVTVQGVSLTDENLVRYGRPPGDGSCPTGPTRFAFQSGFGFEGIELPQSGISEGAYFPVGRFCHYNNPITLASDGNNYFNQVPLNLTISNIACDAGWTRQGSGDLLFTYLVNLVETVNGTVQNPITCEFGPADPQWPGGSATNNVAGDLGPNRNGCADGVNFTASSSTQTFTCTNNASPDPANPITQPYTVSILGFTQTQAGGVCPSTPIGTVSFNQIYTAETAQNCFCVYAAFTKGQITPVVLKNLSAVGVEDGIQISWETVTETNNLGFNIMRAESVDGEQVQVNPELIMSEFAPGGMFGAAYEYLDNTALEGITYYYWLIDVPLDGSLPGVHGPISAIR